MVVGKRVEEGAEGYNLTMLKYAFNPRPEKSIKVYGRNLRISNKNSIIVCKAINGMSLKRGKKLLEDLKNRKRGLNGKYYTKVVEHLINLIKEAEANAEYKGLDVSKLHIWISAHKSFKFYTPRRFKLRRRKTKMTNIQLVLMEK